MFTYFFNGVAIKSKFESSVEIQISVTKRILQMWLYNSLSSKWCDAFHAFDTVDDDFRYKCCTIATQCRLVRVGKRSNCFPSFQWLYIPLQNPFSLEIHLDFVPTEASELDPGWFFFTGTSYWPAPMGEGKQISPPGYVNIDTGLLYDVIFIISGLLLLLPAAILSILGNAAVLVNTAGWLTLLKAPELLTVNLAITDIGMALSMYPLSIASAFNHAWIGGDTTCLYYGLMGMIFSITSIMTLAVMGMVRYLVTGSPPKTGSVISDGIWGRSDQLSPNGTMGNRVHGILNTGVEHSWSIPCQIR